MKEKYLNQKEYNNERNESSFKDLEQYQKEDLQKKLYFDRTNIDLASLDLLKKYNENNFNQIEKSREYNKISELLNIKILKIN